MSLNQAISTALAGLRANQTALSLVSGNVANAETPGFIRKTATRVSVDAGDSSSVAIAGVNRELDQFIQDQVRTETSGAAFARTRADILSSLQSVYGDPASNNTIEAAFNNFTTALQALSTSPESQSAHTSVLTAAQALSQQLNSVTDGIQALRSNAESSLNDSVSVANNAINQIANINTKLHGGSLDASSAELLDERDRLITQLSQLMDIRVVTDRNNSVSVFTTSGMQLVSPQGSSGQFSFNPQGTINALSTPGTITFGNGSSSIDVVATGGIRSGKIAAYLELRDNTLVQAQDQIDQLAATMASALSDKTTNGTAVTLAAPVRNGFDLDLSNLQSGNTIQLKFTNGGVTRNISIVRVDDPSVLPLSNGVTNDPNDEVIGIDFTGGMANVVARLTAALSPATTHLQFSNTGSTLRVVDDGGGATVVNSASTTITQSSLANGSPQIALFTDGGSLYTGALTAAGPQQRGLAGRINVNPAVIANSSRLIVFNTAPTTPAGDTTRPDFLLSQLTKGAYLYSPKTGIGSSSVPFKGTLINYTQQFNNVQANAANDAQRVSEGQDIALNTLQKKMDTRSGVNMDEEMATLLELQNAYSASARVMTTADSLFKTLLQSV